MPCISHPLNLIAQGVDIDHCPQCRGVWLDRGELDKMIERSAALPQGRADDSSSPGSARAAIRVGGGSIAHILAICSLSTESDARAARTGDVSGHSCYTRWPVPQLCQPMRLPASNRAGAREEGKEVSWLLFKQILAPVHGSTDCDGAQSKALAAASSTPPSA